jgi:hypothetical protein
MKRLSTQALSIVLVLLLALLSACSPSPTSNSDPIDDLGGLADANGDVEATLQVVSVAASNASLQANGVRRQVFHTIEFTYKGKPINGLCVCDLAEMLGLKGSNVQIKGKVQKVKGVAVFTGVAQGSVENKAVVAGLVLVAAGKTLPTPSVQSQQVQAQISFNFDKLSLVIAQPRPELEEILFFRTASGVVGLGKPTQPTGLSKGLHSDGTMNCNSEVVQTGIGPVGDANCQWKPSGSDTAKGIIAILIGL